MYAPGHPNFSILHSRPLAPPSDDFAASSSPFPQFHVTESPVAMTTLRAPAPPPPPASTSTSRVLGRPSRVDDAALLGEDAPFLQKSDTGRGRPRSGGAGAAVTALAHLLRHGGIHTLNALSSQERVDLAAQLQTFQKQLLLAVNKQPLSSVSSQEPHHRPVSQKPRDPRMAHQAAATLFKCLMKHVSPLAASLEQAMRTIRHADAPHHHYHPPPPTPPQQYRRPAVLASTDARVPRPTAAQLVEQLKTILGNDTGRTAVPPTTSNLPPPAVLTSSSTAPCGPNEEQPMGLLPQQQMISSDLLKQLEIARQKRVASATERRDRACVSPNSVEMRMWKLRRVVVPSKDDDVASSSSSPVPAVWDGGAYVIVEDNSAAVSQPETAAAMEHDENPWWDRLFDDSSRSGTESPLGIAVERATDNVTAVESQLVTGFFPGSNLVVAPLYPPPLRRAGFPRKWPMQHKRRLAIVVCKRSSGQNGTCLRISCGRFPSAFWIGLLGSFLGQRLGTVLHLRL